MIGITALTVGAAGSVALVFYAGRVNSPGILLLLFALWVLSPFVALGAAGKASLRWPQRAHQLVKALIVVAPVTSLAVYGRAAIQPMGRPVTAVFLMVPAVTWIAVVVAFALRRLKL